jgi:hypothetical protein
MIGYRPSAIGCRLSAVGSSYLVIGSSFDRAIGRSGYWYPGRRPAVRCRFAIELLSQRSPDAPTARSLDCAITNGPITQSPDHE